MDFIINAKTKGQDFKELGILVWVEANFPIMEIMLRMNFNLSWKVVFHVLHVKLR